MLTYHEIQKKAEAIWEEMDFSSIPLPILDVVAHYGICVLEVDLSNHKDLSGIIDLDKKVIYLNTMDAASHKRFTLAHELGHFLLHGEDFLKANPTSTIYYRKPIGRETDQYEKEANCFAANLLVPFKQLKKFKHLSDFKTAELFAVSPEVIRLRRKYKKFL